MWYPAKTNGVPHSFTTTVVVVVASLIVVLFVSLGISAFLYMRNKKLNKFLTDEEVQDFLNGKKRLDQQAKEDENVDIAVEYMKFNNDYALAKMDFNIGLKIYIQKIMHNFVR